MVSTNDDPLSVRLRVCRHCRRASCAGGLRRCGKPGELVTTFVHPSWIPTLIAESGEPELEGEEIRHQRMVTAR